MTEYDDDICRVCQTYCAEGGGVHDGCKEAIDTAQTDAYAEGRADAREDFRTLLQQTQCMRDGWHPFTALTLQAEWLAALDDASEFAEIDAADKRFPLE